MWNGREAEQLLHVRGAAVVPAAEPPRACPYPELFSETSENPVVHVDGAPRPFFRLALSRRNERAVRLAEEEIPAFETNPLGTLLPDLQVTSIVTLDGETVDHVEVQPITGGGVRKIRARYFVLAAGVIESARLLLLSRSRWFAEGLGNQHGHVGRYLTVHRSFQTGFRPAEPIHLEQGLYRTCALNDLDRGRDFNATQFQLDVSGSGRIGWRAQPEMEPQSENRVMLSRELDSWGLPVPDVRLTYSERDRRTFDRCRAFLDETRARLGAVRRSVRKSDRWRAHPSGTGRMGFDPTSGVVDRDNRVFGLRNLFVSGATTFPTSGTANPTSTVVALTLRLGDHLLRLTSRS